MGSAAQVLTSMINDGRGGFVLVGLFVLFVDLIDFINIVTIYVFLDFPRPSNLDHVLQSFSDSLQVTLFPMFNFSLPFS